MPNYQLGKIYKIVDNTNNNIYVGSTCEPTLARRLSSHVRDYNVWKNGKRTNVSSFQIIENSDYDIVLIENFPCDTKDELHKRERYYIESLECVNRRIEGRTKTEYYNDNKEVLNEKMRKYYIDNKEFVQKINKEYREKHKEELKVSNMAYHQANKEKIHEQKNRVCLCECGRTYTHSNKVQHKKSVIHQDFINSLQNKV